MPRLTFDAARAAVAALGYRLVRTQQGELEVSHWAGDCLYRGHADDLQGALGTARAEYCAALGVGVSDAEAMDRA